MWMQLEIPPLAEFGLWGTFLQCLSAQKMTAGSGVGTGSLDPFGLKRQHRCVNPQ